ncbi:hypothetical protein M422DRAFT_246373 [Sphaerobolus stellatus SS14]|nr:hypothetical protein M422DRAFT_246373 [Sphaerobolus stellatus SS14]
MPLECPGCKKAYGRQDLLTKHLVKCKARQKRSKDIDDLAATLKQTGHSQADKRRRLKTLEGSSRRTKARTETYETNTNASASIVSKDKLSSVVERSLPPVTGSHIHRGNTLVESRLELEGMDIEPDIHEQENYLRSMAEQLDSTVQVANSIENLQPETLPDTVMKRTRRPTHKILDMLPEGPAPLPPLSPVPQPEPEEFRRSYVQLSNRSTTIPDESLGIEELSGKLAPYIPIQTCLLDGTSFVDQNTTKGIQYSSVIPELIMRPPSNRRRRALIAAQGSTLLRHDTLPYTSMLSEPDVHPN